jgi:DNA-directed RNA polymerase specialized sigma24 family protein
VSSREWGRYTEHEVHALIDNYMTLRHMKHNPSIHVRLMDLEVGLQHLSNKLFQAVLVYGILRFEDRAAASVLQTSHVSVRKRYRQGVEEILYRLNGDE